MEETVMKRVPVHVCAVSLLLLLLAVAGAPTTQAQSTSTIVFARVPYSSELETSYSAIWKIRDDGTGEANLTPLVFGQLDHRPSICPKHRRIAFDRTSEGQTDIYKMSSAGLGLVNITSSHPGILHEDPDCGSPDGVTELIVYRSERDSSFGEIYTMDLNGGTVTRLTFDTPGNTYYDYDPAWCGNFIVFSRRVDSNDDYEIWRMDADGQNQEQKTINSVDDRYPSCNPSGTFVAFSRKLSLYETDIFKKDLGPGGVETNITDDALYGQNPNNDWFYSQDLQPAWSPGGTQIAFAGDKFAISEEPEIYKKTADTSEDLPFQLTTNSDYEVELDWGELAP